MPRVETPAQQEVPWWGCLTTQRFCGGAARRKRREGPAETTPAPVDATLRPRPQQAPVMRAAHRRGRHDGAPKAESWSGPRGTGAGERRLGLSRTLAPAHGGGRPPRATRRPGPAGGASCAAPCAERWPAALCLAWRLVTRSLGGRGPERAAHARPRPIECGA
jgi:hypothetical protein